MQLASLFQDHAVLQRHTSIPVWGTGTPGEKVTVRLADLEAVTTVNTSGHWLLRLPALPAGGPHQLTAEAASGTRQIQDILVGEVWICSGQSNMEWKLNQVETEPEKHLPPHPNIRLLTVTNPTGLEQADAVQGQWTPATSEALAAFSAVGGYFGRFLQEKLQIPIGLICNAWGGTRVQAWMSREALMQEPEGRDEIRFYEAFISQNSPASDIPSLAQWERQEIFRAPENLGLSQGWAAPEFENHDWETLELPGYWQARGIPHNGVLWFRRTIPIPSAWQGRELELSLGPIDKHDETWANGTLIGTTGWETENAWAIPRQYRIAPEITAAGDSVTVAIRARSHVYAGGFSGTSGMLWLAPVGADPADRIPLDGQWRYKVEHNWGIPQPPKPLWGPENPNTPAMLFNNRIAPLIPYAFRGVIWYQGESNVGEANLYRRFLPRMIQDWRRAWGGRDFPFIQVQLANYLAPSKKPLDSSWAALREAQASALSLDETGLAVAIDLGEAGDIHPRNKRDVGLRLAQCALHQTYDRPATPLSPQFHAMSLEADGRVRCTFRHTGGQLIAKGGPLRHFALAGLDGEFHWAEAVIESDTVVISSPQVPHPYSVRYAWSDNPEGCNLFNAHDLPATPFRSDAWPVS